MCFMCPDCNAEPADHNSDTPAASCSDCLGCNTKLMGGYAGLATAMSFATEYQGEATPHGHGFVSLANMYQHNTLEAIGNMIERNSEGIPPEAMLERITRFCEHMQREDHYDQEQHDLNLERLEKQFHANNEGAPEQLYLSVRPPLGPATAAASSLWQTDTIPADLPRDVEKDAEQFKTKFQNDAQFIFIRVQHHWHDLAAKGNRGPLGRNYFTMICSMSLTI